MKVSIIKDNSRKYLEKNKSFPFYREDKLNFNCNDLIMELDLFNSHKTDSRIDLLTMRFPNNKKVSIEDLRKIADLFPILKEKYYEKTGVTTFELEYGNETTTPFVAIINCDFSLYVVCFALFGGEYGRNPGSSIMLLDIKRLENIKN